LNKNLVKIFKFPILLDFLKCIKNYFEMIIYVVYVNNIPQRFI
jgi:hypothetical protein